MVRIMPDPENNADFFWSNLDETFPEIASELRQEGYATVSEATWDAIQRLVGFANGPHYAKNALLVVSDT